MFAASVDDEIQLKLLQTEDAEELIQLVDQNRTFLRRWLPWVDDMRCVSDAKQVINGWLK